MSVPNPVVSKSMTHVHTFIIVIEIYMFIVKMLLSKMDVTIFTRRKKTQRNLVSQTASPYW